MKLRPNPSWRLALIFLVWVVSTVQGAEAPATPRIALVIGNANYKSAPLKNPVNDARAVSRALEDLGFEVLLRENLSQQAFLAALREFGTKLRNPEATGLFYYAGHGMQVKGANYLIPVDAAIEGEDEIRYMALDANQVLDKMEQAGNRLNIVILDACRDNPFARSFRSKQSGLAQMDAPSGMLIAFATAPGSVAYDGDGVNGVYTKHLLRNLTLPGLPVELVLKRVREGVSKDTDGKQIPWESSSLLGDFYFKTAAVQSSVPSAPDSTAVEIAFWNSVRDSGVTSDYRAYLDKYPNGQFALLATARLNEALAQAATKKPTQPPTQVALAQPATAGQGAPPSQPRIGDSWTYDLLANGKRRVDTLTMTIASIDGDRIRETLSGDATRSAPKTRTFGSAFDPAEPFQETRLPGGYLLVEFSPYLTPAALRAAGKEWQAPDAEVTIVGFQVRKRTVGMTVKVVGPERVTVPAGEYDTIRVEARSGDVLGQEWRAYAVYTYWYSTQLNRAIKISRRQVSQHANENSEDVFVLKSYRSAAR